VVHTKEELGAKLIDIEYGEKVDQQGCAKTSKIGTSVYMAPEVELGGQPYDAKKADVFSLGIFVHAILRRAHPPIDDRRNPKGAKDLPSKDFAEFLQRCCYKNPKQRDSASDVTQKIWQEREKPSARLHGGGATGSAHPQSFQLPL
jgi:serine/threonine protein kinase